MTALPLPPRRPLLTVADYVALPDDGDVRLELQEGVLMMSPRPVPDHQLCQRRLCRQIEDQALDAFDVVP
jgi:Uma2 family endonuclease